jgi:peptidoglycan/LPS O-acetylase OafA/YrhL
MSKPIKHKNQEEQPSKRKPQIYTGGFIILCFILLMTIFLISTQPQYHHRTIILFGLGAAILILITMLFSILHQPVRPSKKPLVSTPFENPPSNQSAMSEDQLVDENKAT